MSYEEIGMDGWMDGWIIPFCYVLLLCDTNIASSTLPYSNPNYQSDSIQSN